ncbi:MAG: DUF4360 domain-containing protein [Proteobacteria bacterium]|nr:DUF4360 domain-containing protein [Pseudomonadota bacterium]
MSLTRCFLSVMVILIAELAQAQNAPSSAVIQNVSLSGSGCSEATAAVSLSTDLQDLSILFDNFVLEADSASMNPRNFTVEKTCTVSFDVVIPAGWAFSFRGVDYRGFANLPARIQGYQRLLYQAPQSPITSMRDASFMGPYQGNYTFQAAQKPGRNSFTPCGMQTVRLNMNAVLGVRFPGRGAHPVAMMALDSQDLSMKQTLQMEWRRCF